LLKNQKLYDDETLLNEVANEVKMKEISTSRRMMTKRFSTDHTNNSFNHYFVLDFNENAFFQLDLESLSKLFSDENLTEILIDDYAKQQAQ
jgi:hypothetical protein